MAPGFAIGRISDAWFEDVSHMVRAQISPDTASLSVLRSVQQHNPDSFWGLFQREGDSSHGLTGFYGQLLLNETGHRALLDRAFDRVNPSFSHLARSRENPSAVYIWCIVAKRKGALLQAALLTQLRQLAAIPYYATLATDDSFRVAKSLGIVPVTSADDRLGGLFRLPSVLPTLRSAAERRSLKVKIVETAGELEQAKAIRALAFVGEQSCPYAEEFDGNDYSAQHLLGYVGEEPGASMRIRFFAGFAKWERYCVLPKFRRTALKDQLIDFATDITTRKGYEKIYFLAEPALAGFWERRGFPKHARQLSVTFSDRNYTEFCRTVAPRHDALSLSSDPMVLNRPEGRWDMEGILDQSAKRQAAPAE